MPYFNGQSLQIQMKLLRGRDEHLIGIQTFTYILIQSRNQHLDKAFSEQSNRQRELPSQEQQLPADMIIISVKHIRLKE